MTCNRRSRGFTLIELMIVVVIISVLSAIAYPSYQTYTRKGNRAGAQTFLMDGAQRQQQYFLDNRSYAPDLNALFGVTTSPIPTDVAKYYTITMATAQASAATGPATFNIRAQPIGAQNKGNEPTLAIDQTGKKFTLDQAGNPTTPAAW